MGGFRVFDSISRHYWAGLVLASNKVKFVRAYDGLLGKSDNDEKQSFKKQNSSIRLRISQLDIEARERYPNLDLKGECL